MAILIFNRLTSKLVNWPTNYGLLSSLGVLALLSLLSLLTIDQRSLTIAHFGFFSSPAPFFTAHRLLITDNLYSFLSVSSVVKVFLHPPIRC